MPAGTGCAEQCLTPFHTTTLESHHASGIPLSHDLASRAAVPGCAASLSATGGFADSGRITVIDFQWPEMTAMGAAWQATPALLLAADVKRIGWAEVMKGFRLRYDSGGIGGSVSFALPQQWKDQTCLLYTSRCV